jgi:hypothetical protein
MILQYGPQRSTRKSGRAMAAVLVIIACIGLNAALAALEIAFVSASKADIRAHADAADVRVWRFLRLRETPERTLSAIQVGTTLSRVPLAVGAQEFASPWLQQRRGLGDKCPPGAPERAGFGEGQAWKIARATGITDTPMMNAPK